MTFIVIFYPSVLMYLIIFIPITLSFPSPVLIISLFLISSLLISYCACTLVYPNGFHWGSCRSTSKDLFAGAWTINSGYNTEENACFTSINIKYSRRGWGSWFPPVLPRKQVQQPCQAQVNVLLCSTISSSYSSILSTPSSCLAFSWGREEWKRCSI